MALLTLAALVAAAGLLVYVWLRVAYRERIALANKLPGPPAWPIVGYIPFVLKTKSASEFFKFGVELKELFPDKVGRVHCIHKVGVFLWCPEDVEIILGSSVHLKKSAEYRFFEPWLGNGLLISSGETWRAHRRIIAPTFHANVLKQFVHLFNRNSMAACRKLEALVGQTVDIHDHMSETTVEILLETAMGVDRSTQKRGYDYAMAVMDMCLILHRRQFRPWLWFDAIFNLSADGRKQTRLLSVIHGLTHQVLLKRRAERKQGVREGLYKRVFANANNRAEHDEYREDSPAADLTLEASGLRDDLDEDVGEKKRIAFLDQMMDVAEGGVILTDKEVEDQVNTIMFEGHDTTAAASSFFLAVMGVHQDVQERCAAELRDIFGDSDRPVTFQDTLEMKYLERCILETLRMFPPVPMVARQLTENVTLKTRGYVVPEGTTVVVTPFGVHRDPALYPNPDTFDPDNFLPEKCAKRHYYAFIPFSAGPRSCVGRKYAMLKLKILLATVLRRFRVEADIPLKDFKLTADIILKREEGHPVRLYARKAEGMVGER